MRIGIDARYLSHGLMGGVHTYLRLLVPALIERAGAASIFLYADTKAPFEIDPATLPENVTLRLLPYRNPLSAVWLDMTLQRAMAQDNLDVAHFPANFGFAPRGVRSVITLHDAINILPLHEIIIGHPKNARTIGLMSYLHLLSSLSVRRADAIVTVSEASRREIIRVGRLPEDRVVAIKYGPAPHFRRLQRDASAGRCHDLGIGRPFFLADALKNPAVIARAWRRLPEAVRSSYQMLFFSRVEQPPAPVQEMVRDGYAQVLIRPGNEDLVALYNQARGFVFPSLYEGLGLPPLEAMKCGAPVIASNRGSVPEVVGDAAIVLDAQDDATLAQAIQRLIEDEGFHAAMQARGFARVEEFSWPKPADRVLDVYRSVLARAAIGRQADTRVSL